MLKTTANGSWYFAPAQALSLGSNTITVSSVSFDRSVKVQFGSGAIDFNGLVDNGAILIWIQIHVSHQAIKALRLIQQLLEIQQLRLVIVWFGMEQHTAVQEHLVTHYKQRWL